MHALFLNKDGRFCLECCWAPISACRGPRPQHAYPAHPCGLAWLSFIATNTMLRLQVRPVFPAGTKLCRANLSFASPSILEALSSCLFSRTIDFSFHFTGKHQPILAISSGPQRLLASIQHCRLLQPVCSAAPCRLRPMMVTAETFQC